MSSEELSNDQKFEEIRAISRNYDSELKAVMERVLRRDSNCIDVGARYGSILRQIVRVAPLGQHYAFEPLEMYHAELRESFPRVAVSPAALSDRAGQSSFQYVVSRPGYSGLLRRRYDRPNETVKEIQVETRRMDDVIPGEVEIALIKIDVEGAELQVLRGGLETLRRCSPFVAFEHGLGAADCYGTTPEQVFDLLVGECGLRISLMADWLEGLPDLTRDIFCSEFYKHLNFFFLAHPERE